MGINIGSDEISSLVEKDRVHKRVYTDPAIFELEMQRIWGTAWVFIGHESQVPKPGDYYATTLGKQSVIMTRHHDGEVKVLFNRCSHKGAQLVGDSCGHAPKFRCSYHGYVFDTDGTLLHIPREEGYKNTSYCKGKAGANVQNVPRMEIYRGFIFASLATQGQDLVSWLGISTSSFDNAIDRSPTGEIEITGGSLRYMHDANWKILLENVTDNMHPQVTHQSAFQPAKQLGMKYSDKDKPLALAMLEPFGSSYDFLDEIKMTVCGIGHSYTGGAVSIHSAYPKESQYVKKMQLQYGEDRTNKILSMNRQNTIIYPSIAFKSALQTIRIYRPVAVNKTIQETWTYKLKGAPDDMLENSVLYNHMIFSPASIAGHDDYEAYHRIQHGLSNNASDWVSQHRHMNSDSINEDGTRSAPGTSDIVFRHEFEAWKHYMTNTV
ncbi:MAG: Rieske 2Fe-2S domain-containing protein [Gammaproteobacteria bacterium]|nr:Rieske 2Fe-2S domain-containing protein [Gammaproteobacteria bacterium]